MEDREVDAMNFIFRSYLPEDLMLSKGVAVCGIKKETETSVSIGAQEAALHNLYSHTTSFEWLRLTIQILTHYSTSVMHMIIMREGTAECRDVQCHQSQNVCLMGQFDLGGCWSGRGLM
jgi:hypothetical protein